MLMLKVKILLSFKYFTCIRRFNDWLWCSTEWILLRGDRFLHILRWVFSNFFIKQSDLITSLNFFILRKVIL